MPIWPPPPTRRELILPWVLFYPCNTVPRKVTSSSYGSTVAVVSASLLTIVDERERQQQDDHRRRSHAEHRWQLLFLAPCLTLLLASDRLHFQHDTGNYCYTV
jgi:hypothetical protein